MIKHHFLTLSILVLLIVSGCSQRSSRVDNHQLPQSSNNQPTHSKPTHSKPKIKAPNTSQRSPTQTVIPQQSPTFNIHPARLRMVNIAKSTIGVPYKWGGNSPREGFDCSGLMKFVHKQALGMNIPRVTAQQRDKSKTIRYAQLQPGDMLFFKTGKRSNHVGVYIGNRKFIHAPSGGKLVHISSMDSSYWHSRFVKFGSFL